MIDGEPKEKTPIVSTRLRQTDKRLLRKIQSKSNTISNHEKSKIINERDLFIEKSIEGNESSTIKQAQAVYRNKNGQFTSPPDASKSKKIVRICQQSGV